MLKSRYFIFRDLPLVPDTPDATPIASDFFMILFLQSKH